MCWFFHLQNACITSVKYGTINIEKEVLLETTPHAEPFKTVVAVKLFLVKNNRRTGQSSDGYFFVDLISSSTNFTRAITKLPATNMRVNTSNIDNLGCSFLLDSS